MENVRADTPAGQALQRHRWADWQRRQGRGEVEVTAHLACEGTTFFPIAVGEHRRLLQEEGFETVEVFWRAPTRRPGCWRSDDRSRPRRLIRR